MTLGRAIKAEPGSPQPNTWREAKTSFLPKTHENPGTHESTQIFIGPTSN